MRLQTRVEFFSDSDRKHLKRIVPGRRFFLAEHNIIPGTKELIHSISYSIQNEDAPTETILELYVDQICKAATHNFPGNIAKVVIQILTEELLGQFCLRELKISTQYSVRWVGDLFAASIVDEIVDGLVGGSYSKIIRDRSVSRLLKRFVRK
jgi:hypothetical protein